MTIACSSTGGLSSLHWQSVGLYSAGGMALGAIAAVFALLFGLLRMSPWPKMGLCGRRVPTPAKAPKRKCCCYCGWVQVHVPCACMPGVIRVTCQELQCPLYSWHIRSMTRMPDSESTQAARGMRLLSATGRDSELSQRRNC